MIIVLFGQPCSGKTTLANALQAYYQQQTNRIAPIVDGDDVRKHYHNSDFSEAGRLKNLQRISDIAHWLTLTNDVVIVSAVFPYEDARLYLDLLNSNVLWVQLFYNSQQDSRGREQYHVKDYEFPYRPQMRLLTLDTSENNIETCTRKIIEFAGF